MKVQNYNYKSLKELEENFDVTNINVSNTLIQVFSGFILEDEIRKIQNILKSKNKNLQFIGTTTAGEIYNGKSLKNSIIISIVEFEDTIVDYKILKNNGDFQLGIEIAKNMYKDDTKLAIFFLNGIMTNGEDVVNGIESINNSVIIAGGMAGDNGNFLQTFVFDKDIIYKENGCVIATLSGERLNIINDYQLNWKPFGKTMKVTKSEKNRLYEIDNIPVWELYRKYLGDKIANQLPISATEFPIIKNSDGMEICRAFAHVFEDKSILTIGNLNEGDEVQFAIGDVDLIVNHTKSNIKNIIKTKPEVIFNYSCVGRMSFLESQVEIELNPFTEIAPTVGFFTYGEIMCKNNKNFVLTNSLTFLGLSENNEEIIYEDEEEIENNDKKIFENKRIIILEALTNLSNTVINELNESKAEVEKSNQKIKDSIKFASLIQQALLPEEGILDKYVKEHFIFWQPKDIVGGDIYFITEFEENNEIIVMVIDGAGHGVPGAFVTMLVKAIKAHIDANIKDGSLESSPAKILEYFNVSIKTMLKQKKGSRSNAGFDGGVLCYNKTTKECKFAGAKIDLYIINDNEFNVINGDNKHVGFVRTHIEQKYTEHKIKLKENMKLYMTTDGYLDQEGENKSRFGTDRFEKMLLEISNKSFKEQKNILIEELNNFKKDKLQTDDITVVGLEF